ncbi:hypothetical protein B0H11DRAFT_2059710 [Mycena galericulata]|nr:hypothetical protein B0H11DRAFT_2059710 [Mycena galericulata]
MVLLRKNLEILQGSLLLGRLIRADPLIALQGHTGPWSVKSKFPTNSSDEKLSQLAIRPSRMASRSALEVNVLT